MGPIATAEAEHRLGGGYAPGARVAASRPRSGSGRWCCAGSPARGIRHPAGKRGRPWRSRPATPAWRRFPASARRFADVRRRHGSSSSRHGRRGVESAARAGPANGPRRDDVQEETRQDGENEPAWHCRQRRRKLLDRPEDGQDAGSGRGVHSCARPRFRRRFTASRRLRRWRRLKAKCILVALPRRGRRLR